MRIMHRPHAITAEQLAAIDDPPWQHELVRGELRTMSPAGFQHGTVCVRVAGVLDEHVSRRQLGQVVINDVGFVLARGPDTVLGPDIAFVATARVPRGIHLGFFEGPPDLAVEVRSEHDSRPAQRRKAEEWLRHGTRSVWLVDPKQRTVTVLAPDGRERELAGDATLEDPVVPGLAVTITRFFEVGPS